MNNRRRELKRDYKQNHPPMGIFQIRNIVNDKVLVRASLNLPGIFNRHKFQLSMGSHPNKMLQAEWREFGSESFAFEILDELAAREGPGHDYREDLAFLEELWLERLQPYGDRGYNEKKKGKDEMLKLIAGVMLFLFILAVVTCTLLLHPLEVADAQAKSDPNKKEWIQLFNGKDLNGWDIKIAGYDVNDNFGNTFRVENGVLKVAYDKYDKYDNKFGHIFYREKFSHYIIAVEYRFMGEQSPGGPGWATRNSGIMFHSQSAQSMGKQQDFPISIEVQLLGGLGRGPRTTANLCTPGTHVVMNGSLFTTHCVNSTSKTYDGDQWVRVEVEVLGDSQIKHLVEGQVVLSYEKPQIGGGTVNNYDEKVKKDGTLLSEGYIALQSESHPIEFRKVELLNLTGCTDSKASNYKSYYVKADNSKCRYERIGR